MDMSRNRFHSRFAWAFALCIACLMMLPGIYLHAQTVYGSMAGTIIDPSGGAIPGASVTITNLGTSEKRSMVSDATGGYRFVNLTPGRYRIEVEMAGFKHFTRDNLLVEVQAALRIDVSMQVGQLNEVVEVSSASPLLQTESGTLSQIVESRTVTEMPLNGRNVMNLIALTPGVITQSSAGGSAMGNQHGNTYSNPGGWGNYQMGGGMANQSAEYLDGVPLNASLGNRSAIMIIRANKTSTSVIGSTRKRFLRQAGLSFKKP